MVLFKLQTWSLLLLASYAWLSANTITVTQRGDAGPGSLRQALLDANAHVGADAIVFKILGDGPHRIQPVSPLPEITDPVTIDGFSQPGAAPNTNPMHMGSNAVLKIEIDGSQAGANVNGLVLTTSDNIVRGLVINRFGTGGFFGSALFLQSGGRNRIEGNYLGTDASGMRDYGNLTRGVLCLTDSNIIRGNLISANKERGIFILGADAHGNQIIGNYIGVDATGAAALGNAEGIHIQSSSENTIGGSNPIDRNIVSGNRSTGITILGAGGFDATGNVVVGNLIGTDATGTMTLGNGGAGIDIYDASNTSIGQSAELAAANVICANHIAGIRLGGSLTQYTHIWANFIGTDANGFLQLSNLGHGIRLEDGASRNKIFYATIKFNSDDGIHVTGPSTLHNEYWRGRISGNGGAGIFLENGGNNHLPAPQILEFDLDHVSGTAPPHSLIQICADPENEGVYWQGWTFADAAGNFNWQGEVAGPHVTALATDTTEENTSMFSAPVVFGANPVILVTNTLDIGEGSLRQALGAASGTTGDDLICFDIPVTDPGYDPVHGVWVIKPELTFNVPPGVTIDGLIYLAGRDSIPSIEIDGSILGAAGMTGFYLNNRNTLRGLVVNRCVYGIWITGKDVVVEYCYLGTDPTGTQARPNIADGILLIHGATEVDIRNNLISGNGSSGVRISVSTTAGNRIYRNRIGLDASGTAVLPNNSNGISIHSSAHDNLVENNILSGNGDSGIYLSGSGTVKNTIKANHIGTDATGSLSLPNRSYGIQLITGACQNTVGPHNLIVNNSRAGILVDGGITPVSTVGNTITANRITINGAKGIINMRGGNSELSPPMIQSASPQEISGMAAAGQRIELFADPGNQGSDFLGTTTSDLTGHFSLTLSAPPLFKNITCTATDPDGNTSEFSAPVSTGIEPKSVETNPVKFGLQQNYPNPFNPVTTIEYTLAKPENISLQVFNLTGELLVTLIQGRKPSGAHKINWDASSLPTGIYIVALTAGRQVRMHKAMLIK